MCEVFYCIFVFDKKEGEAFQGWSIVIFNEWLVVEFLYVGSGDFVWVFVFFFEKFLYFFVFFWFDVEVIIYRFFWLFNKMLIKIIKFVYVINYF